LAIFDKKFIREKNIREKWKKINRSGVSSEKMKKIENFGSALRFMSYGAQTAQNWES
jgi:hypothetical protein